MTMTITERIENVPFQGIAIGDYIEFRDEMHEEDVRIRGYVRFRDEYLEVERDDGEVGGGRDHGDYGWLWNVSAADGPFHILIPNTGIRAEAEDNGLLPIMRATMCSCCGNPTGDMHPQHEPPGYKYCVGCANLPRPYNVNGETNGFMNTDGQAPGVYDVYARDRRAAEIGGVQPARGHADDDGDTQDEENDSYRCECGSRDFTLRFIVNRYVHVHSGDGQAGTDTVWFDTYHADDGDREDYEATCDHCGVSCNWELC